MPDQLEFRWTEERSAPTAAARPVVAPRPPKPARPEPRAAQIAADLLRATVQERTGLTVHLTITNNASTMMSVRYNRLGTVARLRLHQMFLDAPESVRKALGTWVKAPKSRKAGVVLDEFIRAHQHRVEARAPREVTIRTQGETYDLQRLFDEVNAEHFDGRVACPITWGKMPTKRRRRSIRFGSYMPGDNIIRMHPLLDQKFVPEFFVRYIVFHEMLHADLGIEELPSGRRAIHTPEFRRREEAYPDYARAVAWMDNSRNLGRLLRHRPGRR